MTPRNKALTEANAVGNGTPATADLVAVQGYLNAAIAAVGTELRGSLERLDETIDAKLKENRDAHRAEHADLHTNINEWRQRQGALCAALMAPYRPISQALGIVGWFGRHPKSAAVASSIALAVAAIVGGLLLPGQ